MSGGVNSGVVRIPNVDAVQLILVVHQSAGLVVERLVDSTLGIAQVVETRLHFQGNGLAVAQIAIGMNAGVVAVDERAVFAEFLIGGVIGRSQFDSEHLALVALLLHRLGRRINALGSGLVGQATGGNRIEFVIGIGLAVVGVIGAIAHTRGVVAVVTSVGLIADLHRPAALEQLFRRKFLRLLLRVAVLIHIVAIEVGTLNEEGVVVVLIVADPLVLGRVLGGQRLVIGELLLIVEGHLARQVQGEHELGVLEVALGLDDISVFARIEAIGRVQDSGRIPGRVVILPGVGFLGGEEQRLVVDPVVVHIEGLERRRIVLPAGLGPVLIALNHHSKRLIGYNVIGDGGATVVVILQETHGTGRRGLPILAIAQRHIVVGLRHRVVHQARIDVLALVAIPYVDESLRVILQIVHILSRTRDGSRLDIARILKPLGIKNHVALEGSLLPYPICLAVARGLGIPPDELVTGAGKGAGLHLNGGLGDTGIVDGLHIEGVAVTGPREARTLRDSDGLVHGRGRFTCVSVDFHTRRRSIALLQLVDLLQRQRGGLCRLAGCNGTAALSGRDSARAVAFTGSHGSWRRDGARAIALARSLGLDGQTTALAVQLDVFLAVLVVEVEDLTVDIDRRIRLRLHRRHVLGADGGLHHFSAAVVVGLIGDHGLSIGGRDLPLGVQRHRSRRLLTARSGLLVELRHAPLGIPIALAIGLGVPANENVAVTDKAVGTQGHIILADTRGVPGLARAVNAVHVVLDDKLLTTDLHVVAGRRGLAHECHAGQGLFIGLDRGNLGPRGVLVVLLHNSLIFVLTEGAREEVALIQQGIRLVHHPRERRNVEMLLQRPHALRFGRLDHIAGSILLLGGRLVALDAQKDIGAVGALHALGPELLLTVLVTLINASSDAAIRITGLFHVDAVDIVGVAQGTGGGHRTIGIVDRMGRGDDRTIHIDNVVDGRA